MSLEVVGLLQKTNNDFSSSGNENGSACFIASQVMDTNDFLVQVFSVVLMVLAVVWAIADFAACWCFQSRERFEKLPVTPLGVNFDQVGGITYGTTARLIRSAVFWGVIWLGLLPLAQVFIQCTAVFALATCRGTTGLIYVLVKCLFMTLQVVYICVLARWNVSLFSKSAFNVFMVHHVVATSIYVCMRTVIESKSFLGDIEILSCSTGNCSLIGSSILLVCTFYLSSDAFWVFKAYANINYEVLYSTVPVIGLVFVAFFLELWNTAQTTPSSRSLHGHRLNIPSDNAEIVTARLKVVPKDNIVIGTTFVVLLVLAGCIAVGYLELISVHYLLFIQLPRLIMALVMTFLAISCLVLIRQNLKIERKLGYMEILIMIALLGSLCDKTSNIVVCVLSLYEGSTVHTESVIGLIEQLSLIIQSILQTFMIVLALQREGRFSIGCCGLARVSNVTYSLAILNLGMSQLVQY